MENFIFCAVQRKQQRGPSKSQSNDKLSRKVLSSSYHIEWKTFFEAICTTHTGQKGNIHTGQKGVLQLPLLKACGSFCFSDKI